MGGDGDDREGDERGLGQRQIDEADALEDAGAVDQGGVLELARDRPERLTHQEGAEGRGEIGRHHAEQAVIDADIQRAAPVQAAVVADAAQSQLAGASWTTTTETPAELTTPPDVPAAAAQTEDAAALESDVKGDAAHEA